MTTMARSDPDVYDFEPWCDVYDWPPHPFLRHPPRANIDAEEECPEYVPPTDRELLFE